MPLDLIEPAGTTIGEHIAQLPRIGARADAVLVDVATELTPELLAGVRALFVLRPVRCLTAAPGVRDLYLGGAADLDGPTARCFSGVVNLRVESVQRVSLDWFAGAPLAGLAFRDISVSDWANLSKTNIERLTVHWSAMPLGHCPISLRRLVVVGWAPLNDASLAPVWDLDALTSLSLTNVAIRNLRKAANFRWLTELTAWPKSFDGISSLPSLRSFHTGSSNICPPVQEIAASKTLRDLEIRARRPPADLQTLAGLQHLNRLALSFGDMHSLADVDSVAFVRSLPDLVELKLIGARLRDADLGFLGELPLLARLELAGAFGRSPDDLRKELAAIPELTIRDMEG